MEVVEVGPRNNGEVLGSCVVRPVVRQCGLWVKDGVEEGRGEGGSAPLDVPRRVATPARIVRCPPLPRCNPKLTHGR